MEIGKKKSLRSGTEVQPKWNEKKKYVYMRSGRRKRSKKKKKNTTDEICSSRVVDRTQEAEMDVDVREGWQMIANNLLV